MKLTKSEEQLMNIIWEKEKAFMKDILEAIPEPKPAATTVATLLKRMVDKGFVGFNTYGNSREYYPLVQKSDYFSKHIKGLIKSYFGNSVSQFASFFTAEANLSKDELEELKRIVDEQLKDKKQ
ncbi:BlaI/MecI/CopY family transcriptional regulator [Acetobacteroides hydrogenigenes]|uniref:Putative transcriptional regulator n=1 Tax=Acetobacteroides hydrogenigenes TaxID=979970 RepID=A0A4V2RNH8_9BACT|nr:BlaI/MecI/CopY family transcriptional regulator [Acetobacteroides hydrogenigenes]TCN63740.1 putative transcriptional regulator [Acetobacteroides hydrogenigenes]